MPIPIPIRSQAGTLSLGGKQTKQELYEEMMAKAVYYWDGAVGFVNGGPEPTSNQGPWLRNGNEWRFWNPSTGSYSLGVFQAGDIMPTGTQVIDETTGWLAMDGRSLLVSAQPLLFAALGYVWGGSGASFNIPNQAGMTLVGAGTGSGLTTRIVGQSFGVESIVQTLFQLAAHAHIFQMGTLAGAGAPQGQPAYSNIQPSIAQSNTENQGSSSPMTNMQPSIVANFKIKT